MVLSVVSINQLPKEVQTSLRILSYLGLLQMWIILHWFQLPHLYLIPIILFVSAWLGFHISLHILAVTRLKQRWTISWGRCVGSLVFSWQGDSTQLASNLLQASLEKTVFSWVCRRALWRTGVNPRGHFTMVEKFSANQFSAVAQVQEFLAVQPSRMHFPTVHAVICLHIMDLMEFTQISAHSSLLLKAPKGWLTAGCYCMTLAVSFVLICDKIHPHTTYSSWAKKV